MSWEQIRMLWGLIRRKKDTFFSCLLSQKVIYFTYNVKSLIFTTCLTTFALHGLFGLLDPLTPWPPKLSVVEYDNCQQKETNHMGSFQLYGICWLITRFLEIESTAVPTSPKWLWIIWCENNPTGVNKPHKRKSLVSFTKLAGSLTASTPAQSHYEGQTQSSRQIFRR